MFIFTRPLGFTWNPVCLLGSSQAGTRWWDFSWHWTQVFSWNGLSNSCICTSRLCLASAILASGLLSKHGLYRPIHPVGFGFAAIGSGLFSILGPNSEKAARARFQLIRAIGLAFIMNTVLPSIPTSLPESDGHFRLPTRLRLCQGIKIPSVIFNGRFDSIKSRLMDENVRKHLSNGRAYGYASGDSIKKL